jgi:hypothetical protein
MGYGVQILQAMVFQTVLPRKMMHTQNGGFAQNQPP